MLDWNDVGTAMLQDAVWANTEKLESDTAYQDTTVKFLAAYASRAGRTAGTTPQECRDLVVKRAPSSARATSCGR